MSTDIAAKPASFTQEFQSCWHELPNKALFLTLFAAWLALFHFFGNATMGYINTPSLLSWMYSAYKGNDGVAFQTDDSHGIIIPFAVIWLLWWKRKALLSQNLRIWTPGLAIVVI